jgi:cytochrome P450
MELVLVLATLLQRYRMAMAPGHPVEGDPSVTLRPRNGVMMNLEARN